MVSTPDSPTGAWFQRTLRAHQALFEQLYGLQPDIEACAARLIECFKRGGKLLVFGNGGSAAQAQHLAAELVNRFQASRQALPAIALSTDSSAVTSIANDLGYDQVFARQLAALGRPGDIALALSTSGTSPNILRGLEVARGLGLVTLGWTGDSGGELASRTDLLLRVPSSDTPLIQEGHLFLLHTICGLIEQTLTDGSAQADTGNAVSLEPPQAPPVAPAPSYFVHPSSVIDDGAEIGEGTKIWYFNHVQRGARIGRGCILGQNINIDRDAVIGNNVKIQNNVSVYKGVIVEDDAFLGPSMVFTNVLNPRSHVSRKDEFRETRVGRGASIGANATVVCGHSVGEYAFVGAGAVVTKDVPPYALVVGNPARIRGWMCSCGVQLTFEAADGVQRATCSACARAYLLESGRVSPL